MNRRGPAGVERRAVAAPAHRTALRDFGSYARFLSVAVLGLTLDLWSKHWAFHSLGQASAPRVIIPGVLEFQTMLNSGALFGIGGGHTGIFLFASACALLLVFWMFAQTSSRRWALHVALGGILAGALGNMYDRSFVKLVEKPWRQNGRHVYMERAGQADRGVVLQVYPADKSARTLVLPAEEVPQEVGFVRDFIKIPTKIWGERDLWPWVFNVADVLLVGGVGLLAIQLLRDRKRRSRPQRIAVDAHGPAE